MKKIAFYFILATVILFSCKKDKTKDTKLENLPTIEKQEKLVFPIPTPYEVTDLLIKAKVPYLPQILNPTQNYTKYLTPKSQAINLGIYGTDLSYVNVFNDQTKIKQYFETIKNLSDELDLSPLFPEHFLQRIEENIDNPDSLYKIATETYYNTYSYLVNRGKGDIAVIILTGSFVEGLYLALQSAKHSQTPQLIYKKIAEQKFTSEQLTSMLEKQKPMSDDVEEILSLYRPIDAILRKVKFQNDEPILDSLDIALLDSKVEQLRNTFISME